MGKKTGYLLKGLLFAVLLTGFALLILAGIMYQAGVSEQVMQWLVLAAYTAAALVGGLYFAKHGEKRRFLWGLLFGAVFFALYLLAAACFGTVRSMELAQMIRMLALSLAGGMAGGMVSGRKLGT